VGRELGHLVSDVDMSILELLADGRTTAAVARQLQLSERTVRRRVRRMAEHLGVGSTIEVVVETVRQGLV
jgi:DNA-binding NarL/FixJ family response regulator